MPKLQNDLCTFAFNTVIIVVVDIAITVAASDDVRGPLSRGTDGRYHRADSAVSEGRTGSRVMGENWHHEEANNNSSSSSMTEMAENARDLPVVCACRLPRRIA